MVIAEDNTDSVVDYAMPMMKIEKLMRRIHDLCLEQNYGEAGGTLCQPHR